MGVGALGRYVLTGGDLTMPPAMSCTPTPSNYMNNCRPGRSARAAQFRRPYLTLKSHAQTVAEVVCDDVRDLWDV
jgi:hypothetical protein